MCIRDRPIVEHSSTLRVRVLESSETFAVDDYFFMFFDNSGSNLKETINLQLAQLGMDGSQVQIDFNKSTSPVGEESNTADNGDATPKRGRSPSILKRVLSPVSRMHRDGTSMSLPVPRLPKSPNRVKQRLRSVTDSLVLRSPGTGNVEERIILEHHSSSAKTDAASAATVSYTHLDVYKRQHAHSHDCPSSARTTGKLQLDNIDFFT